MKVYGTVANVYGEMLNALKRLGYSGHHGQLRIVCKAKSLASANRKCEDAGMGKIFHPSYTSVTGNKKELSICESSDIVIGIDQAGELYVTIEEVCAEMANNM
jgi:predicted DNA-binding ArsR family transcriptional regulator